jgi:hypothetical protein
MRRQTVRVWRGCHTPSSRRAAHQGNDLRQKIAREFSVELHERSVGKRFC